MPAPRTGWERLEEFRKDYLTPGVVVPVFIIGAFVGFLCLEVVFPAVRDRLAFYGTPPGVVDKDPVKTATKKEPFVVSGRYGLWTKKHVYIVTPLFDYAIEARVLHARRYYSSANAADLIPFDLALGWRNLSNVHDLRRYVAFHHENSWGRALKISLKKNWREIPLVYLQEFETGQQYSNNHVIPADDRIFSSLEKLEAGDIVRLKGFLVNLTRPGDPGWQWKTSPFVREDANKYGKWGTGENSDQLTTCDTIFVTAAEILPRR